MHAYRRGINLIFCCVKRFPFRSTNYHTGVVWRSPNINGVAYTNERFHDDVERDRFLLPFRYNFMVVKGPGRRPQYSIRYYILWYFTDIALLYYFRPIALFDASSWNTMGGEKIGFRQSLSSSSRFLVIHDSRDLSVVSLQQTSISSLTAQRRGVYERYYHHSSGYTLRSRLV